MALINNFLELRSDAFKITHHNRRPIPMRADSIGPWLESLSFLTWLATLSNSALVYLFRDAHAHIGQGDSSATRNIGSSSFIPHDDDDPPCAPTTRDMVCIALVIALCASHGFIVVRAVIRYLLEKTVWEGSKEAEEAERNVRAVNEQYLKSVEGDVDWEECFGGDREGDDDGGMKPREENIFWGYEEGLDEIWRYVKDV